MSMCMIITTDMGIMITDIIITMNEAGDMI